jgi:hypothetical protein
MAVALAVCLGHAPGAIAQSNGIVEGTVADRSEARLPGVTVELLQATPAPARAIATAITDAEGAYRIERVRPGDRALRFTLSGFSVDEQRVHVTSEAPVTATVTLEIEQLSETVHVTAAEIKLEAIRTSTSLPPSSSSSTTSTRAVATPATVINGRRRPTKRATPCGPATSGEAIRSTAPIRSRTPTAASSGISRRRAGGR